MQGILNVCVIIDKLKASYINFSWKIFKEKCFVLDLNRLCHFINKDYCSISFKQSIILQFLRFQPNWCTYYIFVEASFYSYLALGEWIHFGPCLSRLCFSHSKSVIQSDNIIFAIYTQITLKTCIFRLVQLVCNLVGTKSWKGDWLF